MGRAPCCSKVGLHRGPWTSKEDSMLTDYIKSHGEGHWRSLPKQAGLLRCGKSCRLRWMNYLRPDIKRGNITAQEDDLIIRLHSLLGNRWSLIAGRLPGRTDNEIKNYWNTRLSKKIPTTLASPPKKTTSSAATHANKQSNPVIPVSKLTPALEIEIKHMVHQPKPVRVGLIKNMSGLVLTSESNNNTNYLDSSSFSGENIMSIYNSSSEEGDQEVDDVLAVAAGNNGSDAAWTDENIYNGIYGDEGMDGAGSVELFMSGRSEYDARNNNNGVWERLYEEYLQLTNDGGQVEWQPEEESLLI